MDGHQVGEVLLSDSSLEAAFREVLARPSDGIIGLVDDLLRLCHDHGVQVDWHGDCCRLRRLADAEGFAIEKPLRRPVFRAILARLAALCNERTPQSVSPFGGKGELALRADSGAIFQCTFANTREQQYLELMPIKGEGH